MFLPTLRAIAKSLDRGITEPTVTELISGVRETYLKKTTDYAVDPQSVLYALQGQAVHALNEDCTEGEILSEVRLKDAITSGKFDMYGESETLTGGYENKETPACLFSAGAVAQPKVSGLLRREAVLSIRAGNQYVAVIQGRISITRPNLPESLLAIGDANGFDCEEVCGRQKLHLPLSHGRKSSIYDRE